MISFKCSHLATSEGIVGIFKQAANIQKERKDLDKYVAVVVLDEVGLAEDSEKMPLKVRTCFMINKVRHFIRSYLFIFKNVNKNI